jgi:hypothetical protein
MMTIQVMGILAKAEQGCSNTSKHSPWSKLDEQRAKHHKGDDEE